jgi:hypothetical protein
VYRFDLLSTAPNGVYSIRLSASGYAFQSTALAPKKGPLAVQPGAYSGRLAAGNTRVGQPTNFYLTVTHPCVECRAQQQGAGIVGRRVDRVEHHHLKLPYGPFPIQ